MDDSLFDDVNSLLDGDFGDDRILKQIHRACKNNEVISNYERNYVQKLAEQHLGKKSKTPSNVSDNSDRFINKLNGEKNHLHPTGHNFINCKINNFYIRLS